MTIPHLTTSRFRSVLCVALTFALVTFAFANERTLVTGGGPYRQVMLAETDLTKSASMVLDPSTGGGDLLHVRALSADVSYSLVLPTGVVVNAANAPSYGFIWQRTEMPLDPAPGEYTGLAIVAPGWNDLITFPPSQPAGTYELQIARPVGGLALGVSSTFYSRSGVRLGITTKQERPEPGQSPTVVAVLTDGALPISGATVQGKAHPVVPIASGVSVGNWQKRLKTDIGEGRSLYVYSADLANSASPYSSFRVQVKSPDPDVSITDDTVWFRDTASGETRPCTLCLELTAPTSPEPDTSSFAVAVVAEAPEIPFVLVDSTPEYPTSGDGVYSGTFPANLAGEYWLDVEASGSSQSQRPFARQAGMHLQVASVPASLVSFSDTVVDTDGDSLPDGIRITATIHVNEPGEYYFGIDVAEPGTRGVDATGIAELPAGTQQMSVLLHRQSILRRFQSDGPYELRRAILKLNSGARRNSVADSRENAGVTGAYPLSTWKQGRLHLVDQAQLQAVDTDAAIGFEFLRLSFRASVPTADACGWSVTLTDSQDDEIQRLTNSVEVAAGEHDFVVDFNGPRIVQSGLDGPYVASGFTLSCGYTEISEPILATSEELTASAFTSGIVDFEAVLPGLGLARSEARKFLVRIAGRNGFDEMVDLSLLTLPAGVTGTIDSPISIRGGGWLELAADANASIGEQSVTIQGTAGSLVRTFAVPLRISTMPPEVTVSPQSSNFLHPGMTRQFSATVQNAASQAVQWNVEPPGSATVSPQGMLTAPSAIPEPITAAVVATSDEDPSRVGYATLMLRPPVEITLTPEASTLRAGEGTWVNAILTNHGNTYDPTLSWMTDPYPSPDGWIVPHPLRLYYHAPSAVAEPTIVTITATFAEDPAALGTTILTLVPDIRILISPTSATLRPNETQAFTATVLHDPSNAGVAYSLSPQLGSIDLSGLYTAPALIAAPASVTLTATSVADPARSATAIITLLPPPNPRVTLSAPLTSIEIPPSSMNTLVVNLTRVDGYAGDFALSATGLPAGVTASFSPASNTPASPALLVLTTDGTATPGAYPFTVVATAAGESDSLAMTLNVIAMPEFIPSTSAPYGEAPPGSSWAFPAYVAYRSGWTGYVVCSMESLPAGFTAAIAPPSQTSPGPLTITITAASSVAPGVYGFTLNFRHLHNYYNLRQLRVLMNIDPEAVPDPWLHSGVGAERGASRQVAGALRLNGPGERIGGTSDAAQFLYQPLSGNFTILTRVESQTNAIGSARAGLMVRESLAADARSYFVGWAGATSPSKPVLTIAQRATAGTESAITAGPPFAMPYWLKLTRVGNVFTAYSSYDGLRWRIVGSPSTIAMAASALVGLAAAGDVSGPSEAVFGSTVAVTAADFRMSANPREDLVVTPAESQVSIPVSADGAQGYSSPLQFAVEDLPAGVQAEFFPAEIGGPGSVEMRLTLNGLPPGTYPYHVSAGQGSSTRTAAASLTIASTLPPGVAPYPWLQLPLADPTDTVGSAEFAIGSTTIATETAHLDAAFDGGMAVYQPLLGNATITSRVDSVTSANAGSEAGVGIRESMAPDAAFLSLSVKADGTLHLSRRASAGALREVLASETVLLPVWLRLSRTVGGLVAERSGDGAAWTPVGSAQAIPMGSLGHFMMAVNAGTQGTPASAIFSNTSVFLPEPDFEIQAIPGTRQISSNEATHYVGLKSNALYGFEGSLSLSLADAPTGLTASFYPPLLEAGATGVLRLHSDGSIPVGTYNLELVATAGGVTHTAPVTVAVLSTGGAGMAVPWAQERIGPGTAAGATLNNDTFTFSNTGMGMNGSSDEMQFAYRLISGDATLIGKLTAMDYLYWAKPELCISFRESLAANARHASACFLRSPYVNQAVPQIRTRTNPGYATVTTAAPNITMPYWIRLDRRANQFRVFTSADKRVWAPLGEPVTLEMANSVFAGVGYASGHATGSLAATLSNFEMIGDADAQPAFVPSWYPVTVFSSRTNRAYYVASLEPLNGFQGTVNLAVDGLPSGATASIRNLTPTLPGVIRLDLDDTVPSGSHPLNLSATHNAVTQQVAATLSIPDTTSASVPAPWQSGNLEGVRSGTGTSYSNGAFTITSGDCCLWGTSDKGQFALHPFEGDGSIVAKVASLTYAFSLSDKASITLRAHLGVNAPNITLSVQNNEKVVLQIRTAEFAAASSLAVVTGQPSPRWLKLERIGGLVRGYFSANGVTWTQIGEPVTSPIPARAFAGLIVSPEYSPSTWSATFTDVAVASEWQP